MRLDNARIRYAFILWHSRTLPDGDEDAKLLGVYSTEERAKARSKEAAQLPGFRDHPEGFEISRYRLDSREWREGFSEVDGVDIPAWLLGRER